jgi:hypothetical protein
VAWSYARSYHPDGRATTRDRLAFFAPLTYDFSTYKALPSLTTTANYNDPSIYVGQGIDYTAKDLRDTDFATRFDGARKFDGILTKLNFGAEYHHMKRDYRRRDWTLNTYLDVPLTTMGSQFVEPLPYSDFFSNMGGNLPRTWVNPSKTAFYAALFTPAVLSQAPSLADLRNSFVVDQKIWGGYVRGDFAFNLGVPVTGNIGVRYASTHQVASGTLTNGTTATPASYVKDYGNWLPSLNIRAELTKQLILRLAASRVVNRPNVTDSAPRITVSRDTPTASGGNPDLNAFLATQLDASLEWYPTATTALTGAVFWKKMDDYITAQNTTIQVPGRGDVLLSTNVNGGAASLKGWKWAITRSSPCCPRHSMGWASRARSRWWTARPVTPPATASSPTRWWACPVELQPCRLLRKGRFQRAHGLFLARALPEQHRQHHAGAELLRALWLARWFGQLCRDEERHDRPRCLEPDRFHALHLWQGHQPADGNLSLGPHLHGEPAREVLSALIMDGGGLPCGLPFPFDGPFPVSRDMMMKSMLAALALMTGTLATPALAEQAVPDADRLSDAPLNAMRVLGSHNSYRPAPTQADLTRCAPGLGPARRVWNMATCPSRSSSTSACESWSLTPMPTRKGACSPPPMRAIPPPMPKCCAPAPRCCTPPWSTRAPCA